MSALTTLIAPFLQRVATDNIEVYNEFSLQHELGFFLRQRYPNHKVQFERNVKHFFPTLSNWIKHEIDIALFQPDPLAPEWAIELKYPRNGQYPEQMFSFCKDVLFAEQLKAAGFAHAGLLIFAEDPLFWRGAHDAERIYRFFRSPTPLQGSIVKPTGARNQTIQLSGSYPVEWKDISNRLRCAVIEAA